MSLSRRALFAAPMLLVASPVFAATREMDVSQVFVFLDNFLRLPAADRARLKVSYYLTQKGGAPARGVTAVVVDKDGTRTPIPISADGRFEKLPTLKQLLDKSKIIFEGPQKAGYSVRIGLVWAEKPGAQMDAAKVAACLATTNAIVKKAAGAFGVAAPKMIQVAFPGAAAGSAVLANGQTVTLPMFKGSPAFNPTVLAGAKTLKFDRSPARMEFAGAKHSGVQL